MADPPQLNDIQYTKCSTLKAKSLKYNFSIFLRFSLVLIPRLNRKTAQKSPDPPG